MINGRCRVASIVIIAQANDLQAEEAAAYACRRAIDYDNQLQARREEGGSISVLRHPEQVRSSFSRPADSPTRLGVLRSPRCTTADGRLPAPRPA